MEAQSPHHKTLQNGRNRRNKGFVLRIRLLPYRISLYLVRYPFLAWRQTAFKLWRYYGSWSRLRLPVPGVAQDLGGGGGEVV